MQSQQYSRHAFYCRIFKTSNPAVFWARFLLLDLQKCNPSSILALLFTAGYSKPQIQQYSRLAFYCWISKTSIPAVFSPCFLLLDLQNLNSSSILALLFTAGSSKTHLQQSSSLVI
ncbi:MAG: hypothetical protein J5757_08620 [Lachnospiraceae bacterium]|nr:hypothetical protein [Lachnospiraceae bacterium]